MNTRSSMDSFEAITGKIKKSKLTGETKELFTLLLCFFNNIKSASDEKISKLETEVASLREQVSQYEENVNKSLKKVQIDLDNNDQYERRDTLILSGPNLPSSAQGENCKVIVQNLFREHLSLQVNPSDFSIAHRFGKKPLSGPDKRGFIFKMCRRDLIPDIFKSCKTYAPPFYVNLSLTPIRSKVLFFLRQCKRKYPEKIKSCRSDSSGNVVVFRANPNGSDSNSSIRRNIVNTVDDLKKFACEISVSMDEINMSW